MLKKRDKTKTESTLKRNPKLSKPKILLIDMPTEVCDVLQKEGFNVSSGSFGKPYKVEISSSFQPVIPKASLPNYSEQEVIIINLSQPEILESPEGEKETPDSEPSLWAKCNRGKIDPRPWTMAMVREDFDRIFHYGGLFVVFAEPRLSQELIWGKIRYKDIEIESEATFDNWSFSSKFPNKNFDIKHNFGEEITIPEFDHSLFKFLRKYEKDLTYTATFEPSYRYEKKWLPILFDKFSRTVAGIFKPDNEKGRYLILPKMSLNSDQILSLVREILPELSPHLFPHIEGAKWVERDEYELISVDNLKQEKDRIQKNVQKEIEKIESQILDERKKHGFLHGLITQSGDELVESVIKAFELIGFEKILDVDEVIRETNPRKNKQEDLQIHDSSPTLLVEIKGISTPPHESHTLQVIKYVSRRMKEWKRQDVRGVSLINYQRNIPCLERDNENAFSVQQIDDAIEYDIILVSTWDLFLLIKGMLRWEWDPKDCRNNFYKKGRMSRVPSSYSKLGTVTHFWEEVGVVGVTASEGILNKGDKILYVTSIDYLEELATSIQVENKPVDSVQKGKLVGIKTMYGKSMLKKGTDVYALNLEKP